VKISVLTPSFNSVKTIERAITSVLNQTYKNWEHIIMDGGSNDGTVQILQRYPHLIWKSEKDNGQSDAMNKAFDLSTGDIIVYLNADDEFNENTFKYVIDEFNRTKGKSNRMVITNLEIINESKQSFITTPSIYIEDILNPNKFSYPYNPISYFYERQLQIQIGKFPVNFHYAMDYWYLLRLYCNAHISYLNITAGQFHNYDNKTSNIIKSEIELLYILKQFIKEKYPLTFFTKINWIRAYMKIFKLNQKITF